MTEKELQRLKRVDLLELLIAQTRESDRLKEDLAKAQAQLEERSLIFKESGSIAEAAIRINHVFKTTQAAADQYLDSVRNQGIRQQQRWKQMEKEAQARTEALLAQTEEKCRAMEKEAQAKADAILSQAEEKCREMEAEAACKRDAILAQLLTPESDLPEEAPADASGLIKSERQKLWGGKS